jgi:energy-coupling factor transporter ATP-binding protein EcfA2
MADVETKTPVLQVQHISKRFDTTQALDDVSIDLYPGEIHALMGENGAGKSTLINIIGGLDAPDQGQVILSKVGSGAGSKGECSDHAFAGEKGMAGIGFNPKGTYKIGPGIRCLRDVFGDDSAAITRGTTTDRRPIFQPLDLFGRLLRESVDRVEKNLLRCLFVPGITGVAK